MDPLDLITDPALHGYVLTALTVASLAMPLLEWIANRTATDLDNRAVALLARALSFVPRVRLGNTKLSAATVARTSVKPPPIPAKPGDWLQPLVPLVSHAAAMSVAFGALYACAGSAAPDDARAAASRMRADLAEARGLLEGAGPAVDLLCYVRPGAECDAVRGGRDVLLAGHASASEAVDVLEAGAKAAEAIGAPVDVPRVLGEVSGVVRQARELGDSLAIMATEVADATNQGSAPVVDRNASEPAPERAPESAAQPAAAGEP